MRRIIAATALALTTLTAFAAPAHAAEGTLIVGETPHENPNGCYTTDFSPMLVDNQTDSLAVIYANKNCQGIPVGHVRPGNSEVAEDGSSVRIR
jgi:hypothetical protein